MTLWKRFVRPFDRTWALAGLLLAALAAGPAQAQAAPSVPGVVRIGVATAGGGDPVTWGGTPGAILRGGDALQQAFAGTPAKVEWYFFKGAGPAINEALSNRQIDFAFQGDLPAVVGRANGLQTKIVAASGVRANFYLVVPPDSPLQSLADLRGKKVAIFRGTNGHLLANNILAAAGLSERDIRGVNLDIASAQAALVSHGVDASFGWTEVFKLRDAGLARVLYSTQNQQNPQLSLQGHLLVRSEFEQQYPDAVQRVVDAYVTAARWASDEAHRGELFELWARSGVPAASFAAEFEGQPLAVRNSPLIDDFFVQRYRAVADDALKLKLIRREVSLDGWFDARYLERALQQQGLQGYWTAHDAQGRAAVAAAAR